MAKKSVETLLEEMRLASRTNHQIVEDVRALVRTSFKNVTEEVKYGGILFTAGTVQFGGIFAYAEHVSVEFGSGAKITDTLGHLEGSGKGRRHVKLRSTADIGGKNLAAYLPLALQAASDA